MDSVLFICHENFKKINKLFLEKNNINTFEINKCLKLKNQLDDILNKSFDKYNSIFVILNETYAEEILKDDTFLYTKIIDSKVKFIYLDEFKEDLMKNHIIH